MLGVEFTNLLGAESSRETISTEKESAVFILFSFSFPVVKLSQLCQAGPPTGAGRAMPVNFIRDIIECGAAVPRAESGPRPAPGRAGADSAKPFKFTVK